MELRTERVAMKSLQVIFALCAALLWGQLLNAQQWTFWGDENFDMSYGRRAVELSPGRYLLSTNNVPVVSGSFGQAGLYLVDDAGNTSTFDIPGLPAAVIHVWDMVEDPSRRKVHLWTVALDPLTNDPLGLLHVLLDSALNAQVSGPFQPAPEETTLGLYGIQPAAVTPEGGFFVACASRLSGGIAPFDKLLVITLSPNGELLAHSVYSGQNLIPRGMAHAAEDKFLVNFGTASNLGPEGATKALWFNSETSLTDAVVWANPSGSIGSFSSDTTVVSQAAFRLPGGGYLVAARFSYPVAFLPPQTLIPPWKGSALVKYSDEGLVQQVFYPPPPDHINGNNSVQVFWGLAPTPEGNFLWCNERILEHNTSPEISVYKVDADLNILGVVTVDSPEENLMTSTLHIAPTSDGGFLHCATTYQNDSTSLPRAIVRKYGGFTGIMEGERPSWDVQVWPNPGNSLLVAVSGPVLGSARIELFDAGGRLCASSRLWMNAASLPAEGLATGLYGYRIVSDNEGVIATGKWVKE